MDRRTFLLTYFIATLIAACSQKTVAEKSINKESVLVVGAGMAGLAAARKLHDLDYKVTLLEARDRIGGRVWTSHVWPEIPVDLGASWIHGVKENPLTKLADQIGVVRAKTDYDNAILYGTDGRVVYNDVEIDMTHLFNRLIRAAYRNASDGKTIFDVLENTPLWRDLSNQQLQSAMHLINTMIEHEGTSIYGNDIPEPETWQVSRWAADPFARCSYSFNAVGANVDTRTTLAKPINNCLFFAGEATSEDYPATVHGAYLSGIDAATAITDL